MVVESPGDWTCLGDGPEGQAERVGSGRAFQARDPQDQRQFSSLGTEAPRFDSLTALMGSWALAASSLLLQPQFPHLSSGELGLGFYRALPKSSGLISICAWPVSEGTCQGRAFTGAERYDTATNLHKAHVVLC